MSPPITPALTKYRTEAESHIKTIQAYEEDIQNNTVDDNIIIKENNIFNNRIIKQKYSLAEKQKLIKTRQEMLSIEKKRNVYTIKIIYTSISIIFLLIFILCAMYVRKNK